MNLEKLHEIQPLILAGGEGTRLSQVLPNIPKVIAPINGRPFLFYLLDQIIDAGFREVILCVGYKADQVIRTFGQEYKNLNIQYSIESEPLGTGGALRNALPHIDKWVLAMNGDSYIDTNIENYINWHFSNNLIASMILAHVLDRSRYGAVILDEKDIIVDFEEKEASGGEGWINAGIYLFHRRTLEKISPMRFCSLEKEILPALVREDLYGYRRYNTFIDIGTPTSYSQAQKFFNEIFQED